MITEIQKIINAAGSIGTTKRLQVIATLNLGERSEAAKRVLERRKKKMT